MNILTLAVKSVLNRKLSAILLIVSIGLSTMLLVGIQKVKESSKSSFSHSISGTDLVVGARSGEIQLLLYTVFRIGRPVANMSWDSFQALSQMSGVKWTVPVSLGDSHRGFRVLGTSQAYFDRYKFGKKQALTFKKGHPFAQTFDVVLGSEVAQKLSYDLGTELLLSHGVGGGGLSLHKDTVFQVSGILNPTGTPVDRTVHVSLSGIEALHVAPNSSRTDLTPKSISGAFVGLHSKFKLFSIQRDINTFAEEPLMAVIPGLALAQLWSSIATVDKTFNVITVLVVIIAFIGLLLSMFMSLNQRGKEIQVLRALGCQPRHILVLLSLESLLITVVGVVLGLGLVLGAGGLLAPFLQDKLGLILVLNQITKFELYLGGAIIGAGFGVGIIPALSGYRQSVSKGLGASL